MVRNGDFCPVFINKFSGQQTKLAMHLLHLTRNGCEPEGIKKFAKTKDLKMEGQFPITVHSECAML